VEPATENQPSAARVAMGPGALLRQAREAAGMPPEALAQRLRLEPKVIEALESEAYERLPGPAFTKGYLRSIAKELGIDPTPLLAQYTALSNEAEPVLADFESRAPAQITTANARIKLVSYTLGAVVLILIAIWWQRHYASETAAPAADDAALATEPMVPPEPSIPLPYTYTIVEHAGAPLAQPETWRRRTDGSIPPLDEEVLPALAAQAATDPAATGQQAGTPQASTPDTAAADTAPAPTPAAAAVTGELILAAERDSWIEITDLNRSRLYFGLIKGGERIGVSGKPPYDLVIGNAPAVTATFRGAAVDVRRHAINGVTRMAVGDVQ
jgi:cytoskeleton protein RodZ